MSSSIVPDYILNRKGARKTTDVPAEVLEYLNRGLIQTINLSEWLVVDQHHLLVEVLSTIGKRSDLSGFEAALAAEKKLTANSSTRIIGQRMSAYINDEAILQLLSKHTSDVVRCWICWAIAEGQEGVEQLLSSMQPFAADSHFGVREVVIFASKPTLAKDLPKAISILAGWAASTDENVRRYAVEAIRPIGVWTKKIAALQENPTQALPVLHALKADSSRYVQNAVANWLNDASKSQPEWVIELCHKWEEDGEDKATAYIIKRGLRTVNK